MAASLAALALSAAVPCPSALAASSSGIPEPSAPPAVVTEQSRGGRGDDVETSAPASDGTLEIKFKASPDPVVREAQTALVEAWGKTSTMYFDHEFGGVDWRGALQEALDDSFRAASSSSSSPPSSSSPSSSSSKEDEEQKRKRALEGTYAATDAMLAKLGDPYTRVLRPADAGSYVAGAEGEGLSLGMQLVVAASPTLTSSSPTSSSSTPPRLLQLPPVVAAVVPGSPAAKAGIAAGDSLLAIDGQTTRGRPIEDLALSLTREADVTFLPGGGASKKKKASTTTTTTMTTTKAAAKTSAPQLRDLLPKTVHLKPASVSLHAVQWAKLRTRKDGTMVAYIRLAAFNRLAPSDVSRSLDSLFASSSSFMYSSSSSFFSDKQESKPPPVLLLDLRDNSGGAVDAGVDVVSLLLPRNTDAQRKTPPIFFFGSVRDGAGNEERVEVDASKGKLPQGTRVAVLVNGGTASTSELVAAALRGGKEGEEGGGKKSSSGKNFIKSNALLVGEKTFKKARTQRAVPLTGGGLLLVSNLHYISPRGEGVDGVGLSPEVSCQPGEVETSFFVSGGGGDNDDDDGNNNSALLAEDLLLDPCVRVAAEALGAPLAE